MSTTSLSTILTCSITGKQIAVITGSLVELRIDNTITPDKCSIVVNNIDWWVEERLPDNFDARNNDYIRTYKVIRVIK